MENHSDDKIETTNLHTLSLVEYTHTLVTPNSFRANARKEVSSPFYEWSSPAVNARIKQSSARTPAWNPDDDGKRTITIPKGVLLTGAKLLPAGFTPHVQG